MAGGDIFIFPTASKPALGPRESPIQWVPGALPTLVNRPGGDAKHLHQSNAGGQ
jgi:hypothetical protein